MVRMDAAAHYIPSGMNVWEGRKERFDLTGLRCWRELKETGWLERSLGTLGGGNHFIEIDRAADGTNYLVIHSGSRNLGKQVAEYYQALAVEQRRGKPEYLRKRQDLVREYRACGREKEISRALLALKAEYDSASPGVPEDLCWLTGDALRDYLEDVAVCQRFARRSRELMAETLLSKAGLTGSQAFHTVHNYIDTDEMILRKGAIAAHAGEKVLIPINMRDGSVLAVGKGNPEWNYSAPHGAGRVMSRSAAVNTLSMEEYRRSMEGVYTTSVNEQTLDESPMAYKRLSDIVDVIGDTVEILEVLRPVYNFKASSETPPWAK
jgi:RNA-splicing ligase RtcB